jgi:hypothetical protein
LPRRGTEQATSGMKNLRAFELQRDFVAYQRLEQMTP